MGFYSDYSQSFPYIVSKPLFSFLHSLNGFPYA